MKNRERRSLAVLCSVLALLLACAVTFSALVWAKYVSREKKDTVVAAKSFYFESDLLTESGATYTLAPGTDTITVRLKNYADDLRYSDVGINYKVTATNQSDQTSYMGSAKKEDHEISFSNLTPGRYEVVATATAPYTKTLKATFVIPAVSGGVNYSVSDAENSPVLRLTVWTEDYSGPVKLTWPAKVAPDNTDPLLANATGNSITINFENDSEYTFLFFKANPTLTYTKADVKAETAN